MKLVVNTFPLLDFNAIELTTAEPQAVLERLKWLQECSNATQEVFATQLLHQEPPSFHALHAVVLTMSDTIVSTWLALEKSVAAKKVSARWAYKAQLFKYYGIAVERNRKGSIYMFKFPHTNNWFEAGEGEVCSKLAECAFPRAEDRTRYKRTTVSTKSIHVVEIAFGSSKHKGTKNMKV
jgi:hypothetical protein